MRPVLQKLKQALLSEARNAPNRFFITFALFVFTAFWLLISVPVFNHLILRTTGFDFLDQFGSNSLVGYKKMNVWYVARTLCYATTVIAAFAMLKVRGAWIRFTLLIPILLIYQTTLTWPEWVRKDRIFSSEVQTLSTPGYRQIFEDPDFKSPSIKTFDDFYRVVDTKFESNRAMLHREWHMEDLAELKTTFFINVVGNLWHFGNRVNLKREGCVLVNENTKFELLPPETVNVRTYLDSDIACCTDFAMLLKYLLDRADIPNRLVSMMGHYSNEVKLASEWRSYDATVGMSFSTSWEAIQQNAELEPVFTFYPTAVFRKGHPNYSPMVGGLRMALIAVATHDSSVFPHYTYDLPPQFQLKAEDSGADIPENL